MKKPSTDVVTSRTIVLGKYVGANCVARTSIPSVKTSKYEEEDLVDEVALLVSDVVVDEDVDEDDDDVGTINAI